MILLYTVYYYGVCECVCVCVCVYMQQHKQCVSCSSTVFITDPTGVPPSPSEQLAWS